MPLYQHFLALCAGARKDQKKPRVLRGRSEYMPLPLHTLPVGGHFTMGLKEARQAIQLLKPKIVVPIHYNTFDLIKQDINQDLVENTNSKLLILKPGQEIEF